MFRKIGLMVIVSGLACAAAADEAPASKDALAQAIKQYHAHNDCDGFLTLFDQQGEDPARHAAFVMTITNYVCANFGRKVTSVAFQEIDGKQLKAPKDFKGTHSEYTLKPEGAVVIDYAPSNGPGAVPGETSSLSLLYGQQDGKFYLITTRQTAIQ